MDFPHKFCRLDGDMCLRRQLIMDNGKQNNNKKYIF